MLQIQELIGLRFQVLKQKVFSDFFNNFYLQFLLYLSDSQTHKVTVDIINDKPESRVLKSDQNSVNCDDCCRSCSCGQSLTDSSDPDHDQSKSENGECFKENTMSSSHLGPSLSNDNSIGNTTSTSREKITKSSTGTQTVRL